MLTVNIKSKLSQLLKQSTPSPQPTHSEHNNFISTPSTISQPNPPLQKTRRTMRHSYIMARKNGSSKDTEIERDRSSKSRSSCQAGCLRRSSIRKQLKQKKKKNKTINASQSEDKLSNAIDKFYTNLSTMPLDILITHADPQNWLQQQHQTCNQLKAKLDKLYGQFNQQKSKGKQNENTLNAGKLRHQKYLYNRSKLQAVTGILTNIENNMSMLNQLYRQQLRSYASNSSINSSASITPSEATPQSNSPSSMAMNNVNGIKDEEYPSMARKQYKKEQSLYEINDSRQNSNSNSECGTEKTSQDLYGRMLDQFNSNLNKFATKASTQRVDKNGPTKENESMAQFLSTCRSEQSPEPLQQQDTRLSEQRTKRMSTTLESGGKRMESISELFAISLVNCAKNGNFQQAQQMRTILKRLANPNPEPALSMTNSTLRPFLLQIAELKQQLKEKNIQIQNLLSCQQEMQSVIELYKKNQRQNKENNGYASERIKNLEAISNKYEKQIAKYQNIDQQMRQTVKNQTIYLNSMQRQKQELETKLNEHIHTIDRMKVKQLENRKTHQDQLQQMNKKYKVTVQKMQIYKQKYYQILHESELKKMILSNTYTGKTSKIKQIWGILGEHKKNLDQIDESKCTPDSKASQFKKTKRYHEESQEDYGSNEQEQSSSLSIPFKSMRQAENKQRF